MKSISILLISLLLFLRPSFHEDFYFNNYTTDNGLSNNTVYQMENDIDGGLWIATWNGLNYYSGDKFKVFKHIITDSNSIGGNDIKQVVRDGENKIWTLTNQSVSRYDGDDKFTNFFLKNKNIIGLKLSINKRIMVLFSDDRCFIWNGSEFISASKEQLVKEKHEDLIFKKILLSKYPNVVINHVLIDNDLVFFATRSNGLFILQIIGGEYKFKNYTKENAAKIGLTNNEIQEIHKDSFGYFWLAFKDGGISKIEKSKGGVSVLYYLLSGNYKNLPKETIRAITTDFNDDLFLGYYSKGIYKFNEKKRKFEKFLVKKVNQNSDWNRVRTLFTDSNGNVWVGTYAGIIQIKNNEQFLFTSKKNPLLKSNRVYSFFESDNYLWIGSWNGISKLNLNTLQFEDFKFSKKLEDFHVRDVVKVDDELFIATENKSLVILNLKTGALLSFDKNPKMLSNSVFSVLKTTSNQIWIGTLSGIVVLDENKNIVNTFTEYDGLSGHLIFGLLERDDKIWINSSKGISTINQKTFEVQNIELNRFQWQEFAEGAYYLGNDNFYYGGVKGLMRINPKQLEYRKNKTKLNIFIDDKPISSFIQKSAKDNFVKIRVNTVSFSGELNSSFQYKLEGYDKDWKKLAQNEVIFYEKLSSGNYKLLFRNTLKKKVVASSLITIDVVFYKSTWFICLTIAILTSILALFFYLKSKTSIQFQEKLQEEVVNRTKTINKQKEELLLAHNNIKNNDFEVDNFKRFVVNNFKQPLNIIIESLSGVAISPEKSEFITQKLKELLNKVTQWDFLDDVNNLPEYNQKVVSLTLLAGYLKVFENEFNSKKINFLFEQNFDNDFIEIDVVRFKLMIQYFFQVLMSFVNDSSNLKIEFKILHSSLHVNFSYDNTLFINSFNEIERYNFYYKAFKKIVTDLGGEFIIKNEKLFYASLILKINRIKLNNTENYFKRSNIDLTKLPSDKRNILVYCNDSNYALVEALLEKYDFNFVFETDLRDVSKYLSKTQLFNLVIFYGIPFSSDFIKLMKFIDINGVISTMYITERIDFNLQEEAEYYKIDEFIQLPVSANFLKIKINYLTKKTIFKNANPVDELNIKNNASQKYIDEAIQIIKTKYSDYNFNVEALTEDLKISRVKCYRIFKEVLHQTPSDFITQFRMQKALEVLKQGELNISEVSFECGFKDPKYFGKVFKKYYGKSPKAYRS